MDIDEIVGNFRDPIKLPSKTMRWCLAHAEDVLPRFIDILRRHNAGERCSDEEEGSIFFVVHLLGEMAAPEAFPHIMDFITGDPEVVRAVLGDAVTEYLNGILISTYDGDEARLRGCIEDPGVEEYVRSAALDAWAYLVASGKVDRTGASSFLDALVDRGAPQEPHLIWCTYAMVVALLGFDHLKDRVKALIERGLIEMREIRYDEFLGPRSEHGPPRPARPLPRRSDSALYRCGRHAVRVALVHAGGNSRAPRRYDRELTDLFALQDDITDKILEAMHVKLTVGEQAKAYREMMADPETYRLFIQGRAAFVSFTLEGHTLAEKHWTEVAKRQPESLTANNLPGWLHWQKVVLRLSKDPENSIAVAREYGEKALSTGHANQDTYLLLASIERTAGNWGPAIAYADLALELAPTNGDVVSIAGAVKIAGGQPQEGVRLLKRAMRLEPYYLPWIPSILSRGHLMLGQYEEVKAIEEARLASAPENAFAPTEPLLRLAAISVFMDEVGRARQYIEQLLENEPDASVSTVKRRQLNLKDRVFVERYLDALRQAGLPE